MRRIGHCRVFRFSPTVFNGKRQDLLELFSEPSEDEYQNNGMRGDLDEDREKLYVEVTEAIARSAGFVNIQDFVSYN